MIYYEFIFFLVFYKFVFLSDDSKLAETCDDSSDENSDFDWEIEQVLCEVDKISLFFPSVLFFTLFKPSFPYLATRSTISVDSLPFPLLLWPPLSIHSLTIQPIAMLCLVDYSIYELLLYFQDDISLNLECKGGEGKYGFANQKKGIFDKRQVSKDIVNNLDLIQTISDHVSLPREYASLFELYRTIFM